MSTPSQRQVNTKLTIYLPYDLPKSSLSLPYISVMSASSVLTFALSFKVKLF